MSIDYTFFYYKIYVKKLGFILNLNYICITNIFNMKKNSLNTFNVGGQHSQNPLGGIPKGVGSNGQMNTVEEGETQKEDFVYSDRIQLNKEMLSILGLPKSFEGKTIADASKYVDSKFKDRSDKISESTKNGMLDKIAQVQEAEKVRQQAEISNALDVNSTEMDLPQNQMFLGGATSGGTSTSGLMQGASMFGNMTQGLSSNANASNLPMTPKEQQQSQAYEGAKDSISSAIPVFGGLFRGAEKLGKGLGQSIGGDKGGDYASGFLDPFQNVMSKDTNFGEKVLSVMDPVVSGMILHKKNQAKRDKLMKDNAIIQGSKFNNDFALGGPINDPNRSLEGTIDNNLLTADLVNQFNNQPFPNGQFKYNASAVPTSTTNWYDNNAPYMSLDRMNPENNKLGKANLKPAVDWAKNNWGDVLRYAPVAANAMQLANLKKPTYERYNRVDQRFNPEYVDERSIQNIVGNEYDNTINSLTNATNGSTGALRSNILGAGLNKTKALSDAYINSTAQNRAMNAQGQQFNLGVNQTNLSQDNLERDVNARNTAAYDNNKSRLIGQMGTDLGNIGKEEVYKKIARESLGYTWDGKYWIKPDGSKKSDKEIKEEVESKNKKK